MIQNFLEAPVGADDPLADAIEATVAVAVAEAVNRDAVRTAGALAELENKVSSVLGRLDAERGAVAATVKSTEAVLAERLESAVAYLRRMLNTSVPRVFHPGEFYRRGDSVFAHGGTWVCTAAKTSRMPDPNEVDWVLTSDGVKGLDARIDGEGRVTVIAKMASGNDMPAPPVKLGMVHRGVWRTQPYTTGDVVLYDSSSWMALEDTSYEERPSNSKKWRLIASRPKAPSLRPAQIEAVSKQAVDHVAINGAKSIREKCDDHVDAAHAWLADTGLRKGDAALGMYCDRTIARAVLSANVAGSTASARRAAQAVAAAAAQHMGFIQGHLERHNKLHREPASQSAAASVFRAVAELTALIAKPRHAWSEHERRLRSTLTKREFGVIYDPTDSMRHGLVVALLQATA